MRCWRVPARDRGGKPRRDRAEGRRSPQRDAFISLLKKLSTKAPLRRVPPQIAPERLIGGLDLARTLKAGRPVVDRGILPAVDGGTLLSAWRSGLMRRPPR